MTGRELRLQCALTAAGWLGTMEGSAAHRQILSVYNAQKTLPRGYRMKESDAWCAAFVSAAALEAGCGELYPLECSCSRIIAKAREMGIWNENDAHVPEIGEWILYNWEAAESGDDTGAADHVGIVLRADPSGIRVVEGNYDNAVKLRVIGIDDRRVRGFVCPRFPEDPEEARMARYHTISEVPAYGRETIEKLLRDGSLLGVGEGDLGLTEDLVRILVILDRRGKL